MKISNKVGKLVDKHLKTLKGFQGELKELSKEGYESLKASFIRHGYIDPVLIWKNNILDGHQRVKTLLEMQKEGIDVGDPITCLTIKVDDAKQAAEYTLQYVSQHGRVVEEGFYEFLHVHGLVDDFPRLKMELDIPNFNMEGFEAGYITSDDLNIELPSSDKPEFQQITFTLHDSQAEEVLSAIKTSKGKGEFTDGLNENSNGNAIARICETYITQNG